MRTFVSRLDAQSPVPSPVLLVDRSGTDVVLSWTGTGQSCFTAVRGTTPQLSGSVTVYSGPDTSATDLNAVGASSVVFYRVE